MSTRNKKPQAAKPTTQREMITPELAREYLDCNYDNRTVRARWVQQLADTIRRGQWRETHQGIAFDANGRLVDGQHRLMAIVQADIAVPILVTRDLEDGVYRYVDAGAARKMSDRTHLTEQGAWDNETAVSITRNYCLCALASRAPSVELIENTFLSMSDEIMMVVNLWRAKVRGLCTGSLGAAVACYASKHPAKANAFGRALVSGSGLSGDGDPILVLREAVRDGRIHTRTSVHEAYWKTINATRAHFEGRQIKRLDMALEDWRGNVPKQRSAEKHASAKLAAQTRRSGGRQEES